MKLTKSKIQKKDQLQEAGINMKDLERNDTGQKIKYLRS